MEAHNSHSVGLGGDGDEIEAIADVERAFGVKLDYSFANQCMTAGDVFEALKAVIPAAEQARTDLWERFVIALCGITGVDPHHIEPASPLLSQSRFWAKVADASAMVWITSAVVLAAAVGLVFFET
ncbi:MAG: hypothetical protein P8Y58_03695 [Novosphingobium sp.]